jgi:ribosome-associated toxin RatA of RatAB toxin-antitoxin module
MKHVKKSVLLWYSPHQMYALVTDVESYPKFLPWCSRAEVLQRHPDGLTARLHLSFAGIRQAFTTRNVQTADEQVHISLVDGPFSLLEGTWRFTPVALPNETAPSSSRIDLDLRYTFAAGALEAVISPVFDRIANTFVDSFVKRAEQVYGS